jgi:thymidylate synthase (FAD)
MKVIEPSFEILTEIDGERILKSLEIYGRTAYKSEERITEDSHINFMKMLMAKGHESVIEHIVVTIRIICNRGVSHELVRHRIASYTQESTRFCNYTKDKFDKNVKFIKPLFFEEGSFQYKLWETACRFSEVSYFQLILSGARAEEARDVLNNALATEIIVTMNLRSWRNFFRQRTSTKAHPQMREIAIPLLKEFKEKIPVIFDDIVVRESNEPNS